MNLKVEGFLTVVALSWVTTIDGFVPCYYNRGLSSSPLCSKDNKLLSAVILSAKKKRRKRKSTASTTPTSFEPVGDVIGDDDELPEFELEPKVASSESGGGDKLETTAKVDGSTITRAQMGRIKPMMEAKDLLRDRSLESELPFGEEMDAEPLPSFAEYIQNGPGTTTDGGQPQPTGKKKARQAERQAAAKSIADEEAEAGKLKELAATILSKVPFLGVKEGEEFTQIKVIETLTWLGIYSLVGWEVFINSPFFERAAPLSPAVF